LAKASIILISPQMGENIGACARAMKNFGLSDLRIVSPRDGWPNAAADAMSVGARDIIKNAQIFDNISSSIADLDYVYAASAAPRDLNKNYILSKDLNPQHSNFGIMFGRESSGLSNEEISYANSIVTIDTDPGFSSLNLAHAVAVISCELFKKQEREDLNNKQELATKGELEHFFTHLIGALDEKQFFKVPEKKKIMAQNIRAIFNRIDNLSKSEIQTLRGIVSVLEK